MACTFVVLCQNMFFGRFITTFFFLNWFASSNVEINQDSTATFRSTMFSNNVCFFSCVPPLSCCCRLHASATGNDWYSVRKQGQSYGNRVRLLFNAEGNANFMSYMCHYPARWLTSCCDVIAVGRCEHSIWVLASGKRYRPTHRGLYRPFKPLHVLQKVHLMRWT